MGEPAGAERPGGEAGSLCRRLPVRATKQSSEIETEGRIVVAARRRIAKQAADPALEPHPQRTEAHDHIGGGPRRPSISPKSRAASLDAHDGHALWGLEGPAVRSRRQRQELVAVAPARPDRAAGSARRRSRPVRRTGGTCYRPGRSPRSHSAGSPPHCLPGGATTGRMDPAVAITGARRRPAWGCWKPLSEECCACKYP
jgi:hypothetical protein